MSGSVQCECYTKHLLESCKIALYLSSLGFMQLSVLLFRDIRLVPVCVCMCVCVRACVRCKLLGNIHVSSALYISNFKRFVFSHTCRLHSSSSNVNLIQLTMITW